MTTSEITSLIVVPLAAVLLPLIWGLTDWTNKRSQFLELIFRELEEIGPQPKTKEPCPKEHWSKHHNDKILLHKKILDEVTQNRDFILSLPADIVYHVVQLWKFQSNSEQWLYMLSMIQTKIPFWQGKRRNEIKQVKNAWYVLMKEYGEVFDAKFEAKYCPRFSELCPEQQNRLDRTHTGSVSPGA